MKNLLLCAFLICLFSSCLEKIDEASLINTKWELTEMPDSTLPIMEKATLNFADSLNVSGKAFCNNYGGKVEIIDHKLSVKNVFATKMFCKETNTAESVYLKALNEVNVAKLSKDKLTLLNGNKTLLVFTKTN